MTAYLVHLAVAVVVGVPVALAVNRHERLGSIAGLSFLYGTGAIYFAMLGLSLVGVGWSVSFLTGTLFVFAVVVAGQAYRRRHAASMLEGVSPTSDKRALFIDIATAYMVVAYGMYATVARVWQWDFWMIWGLKGRVFLESGGIDWRFLTSRWNEYAHLDYPLLVPMNFAFAGLVGGGWDDRWAGALNVTWAVALLLIVRDLAWRECGSIRAAVITFAASGFALTAHIGLAEGPMIAFGSAAILFIRRAVLFDDETAMRHGALLLGLAGCTKNEGLALIAVTALALALTRPRFVRRLAPAVLLVAPWLGVRIVLGLGTDLAKGSIVTRLLDRITDPAAVIGPLVRHTADPWLLAAIAAGVVLALPDMRRRERFTLLVVGLQLVVFVAVYLVTPADQAWHISASWPRLTRQIAIPLLFVAMIMLARNLDLRRPPDTQQAP